MKQTDTNKIKEVWDGFADKYGEDCRASTPDSNLVELEIRTLLRYIKNADALLDVGCGNGYTDIHLALKKRIGIVGIDISDKLIENARNMRNDSNIKTWALFSCADILSNNYDGFMTHEYECFDIVLTKRMLINILSWDEQREAIRKLVKYLKPNGKLIMMEATKQGYEKVNKLRSLVGLKKTDIRWHNNYLDEDLLLPYLKSLFKNGRVVDFSSSYYILSRVAYPFVLKLYNKEPNYDSVWNKIFSYVPSIGNYGMQKMLICSGVKID